MIESNYTANELTYLSAINSSPIELLCLFHANLFGCGDATATEFPTAAATTIREGVAPPPVAEAEDMPGTAPIAINLGHSGGGGTIAGEKEVNSETATTTDAFMTLAAGGGMTAKGEDVEEEEERQHSNLYWPLYYGDAHVEVGQPFAITCIMSPAEPVQWQRDGEALNMAETATSDVLRQGLERGAFPIQMENLIKWDSEDRGAGRLVTTMDDGGGGGRRKRWMDWNAFKRLLEKEGQEDEEEKGDREEGVADASDGGVEDDVQWLEWWQDLMASEGMDERRLKRNVSELEQFKLMQYYNALVKYKNQPGGGGYYLDEFFKRTNERLQQRKTMRGIGRGTEVEEDDDVEEKKGGDKESVHDYVFSQGQGQG